MVDFGSFVLIHCHFNVYRKNTECIFNNIMNIDASLRMRGDFEFYSLMEAEHLMARIKLIMSIINQDESGSCLAIVTAS